MRFPKLVLAAAVATLLVAPARGQGQGGGPDSAQAAQMAAQQAQMRAMMEQIARQRPVQAESVARKMLLVLQAAGVQQRLLDALKARSQDQYWQEVAQLTVQQQILRQMQDSMRQQLMTQMFGAEALARALQRDYRRMIDSLAGKGQPLIVVDGAPITQPADSARVRAIREQLRVVPERHFAAEDSLRALEIADVERRLAQVRAETVRRRRDR